MSAPPASKWRRARARVDIGESRATIAVIGDSTSAGYGAGTTGPMTAARARSWPTRLAALLPGSLNLPSQAESWFGDAYAIAGGVTLAQYDPRIVMGEGWSCVESISTFGGNLLSAAEGGALSFTPSTPTDRFDLYFAAHPGNGGFQLYVDGAEKGVVDCARPPALVLRSVSCGRGVRTLHIVPTGGGTVYIAGVRAFDSGAPAIDICNLGSCGATSGFWIDGVNPWSPSSVFEALSPDLSIIDLGVNDRIVSNELPRTSLSEFNDNLVGLVTLAHRSGDVLLMGPLSSKPSEGDSPIPREQAQDEYKETARWVAESRGCLWLDMDRRWGRWEGAEALGYTYDDIHLNALGHAEKARAVAAILATV